VNIIAETGHYHFRGRRFSTYEWYAGQRGAEVYHHEGYDDPLFKEHLPPLLVEAQHGLEWECHWENPNDVEDKFGPFTDTIAYLEDGDWVVLTRKGATIYDKNDAIVQREGARAFAEVENALSAGFALDAREAILKQAVAENERAVELANIRYRVGSGDLRGVLQQSLALYAAQVSLIRVRSEGLTQRVNLHLALGGSFDERPAEPQAGEPQAPAESGPPQ